MHKSATPMLGLRPTRRNATNPTGLLRAYFEGQRHLRKGICLLNAGQYGYAVDELTQASIANPGSTDLSEYLVTALAGTKRYDEAGAEVERRLKQNPDDIANVIRLGLLQWKAGRARAALQTFRDALAEHADCAELHFQLGTLLAAMDKTEEAQACFSQAVAIEKNHADAWVGLALCLGAGKDLVQAVQYLERAQRLRPGSARIALLLSCAAQAGREGNPTLSIRAEMPQVDLSPSVDAIVELGRLIEHEPEFVEAFLSRDAEQVDDSVFHLLALAIKQAIERRPRRANLHYLRGKVLKRLGQAEEAIVAAERAVEMGPRDVQTLILLAQLYQQTNRCVDAAIRLEQAIRLGAEYADTYYLLGNLYRSAGELKQARRAYQNALRINGRYEDARKALDSLAA